MKKYVLLASVCALLSGLPAWAQSSAQSSSKDALSAWLRNSYAGRRDNLIASAEKVPDDIYNLRPGPQKEVRTYGQIIGHLADFNYLWCSQAKQEKNPAAGKEFREAGNATRN